MAQPKRELYCQRLYRAITWNAGNLVHDDDGLFHGRKGALRLARWYGLALADTPSEADRRDDIQSSYSVLCVRVYSLRPPIDNREWVDAITAAMTAELAERQERKNRKNEEVTWS